MPDDVRRPAFDKSRLPSRHVTVGPERAPHRAFLYSMGLTDEQIAFSIGKIKEYGLIDSGDTLKLGIGAMTDDRVKAFYDQMVKAGVVKPDIDYKKAYTLQFVDKGVGLDQRPK